MKKEKEEQYIKWRDQFTPAAIKEANSARRWLMKHTGGKYKRRYPQLPDSRNPKLPINAYNFFVKERILQSTSEDRTATREERQDAFRKFGAEWRALSEHAKKVRALFPLSYYPELTS